MIKERFFIIKSHQLDIALKDGDDRDFNDYENNFLDMRVINEIVSLGYDKDDILRVVTKEDGKLLEVYLDVGETELIYSRLFRGYVIPLETYVKIPLPDGTVDIPGAIQVIDIVSTEETIDYTLKFTIQVKHDRVELESLDASDTAESIRYFKENIPEFDGNIFGF